MTYLQDLIELGKYGPLLVTQTKTSKAALFLALVILRQGKQPLYRLPKIERTLDSISEGIPSCGHRAFHLLGFDFCSNAAGLQILPECGRVEDSLGEAKELRVRMR